MKRLTSLVLMLAIVAVLFVGCAKGEAISWGGLFLGEHLPELADTTGDVHNNNDKGLWFSVYNITETQYSEYIMTCKEFGYTVDAELSSISFTAFNEEGYKLNLNYQESQKELSISLDAPKEMSVIEWPISDVAQSIPMPKSTTGKIDYDREDFFMVYIGQMSKEDYAQYVSECLDTGFTVDYSKQDTYFNAQNEDGTELTIRYEGANVISIRVETKEEETVPKETQPVETEKPTEPKSDKLGKEFKAAMDSYEEFMDEYVAFMKKYQKNPSDLGILADYAKYMGKYAEFVEDFEKWEDEDMNAAELAYYAQVQARVTKKLLEIAK